MRDRLETFLLFDSQIRDESSSRSSGGVALKHFRSPLPPFVFFTNQAMERGKSSPSPNPPPPHRSLPEDRWRTSPTSLSTTSSISSSPETKEKDIPKLLLPLLHLPQAPQGQTQPDLLQRRPTPTSGPLLVLYSSPVSFPRCFPSPFVLNQAS